MDWGAEDQEGKTKAYFDNKQLYQYKSLFSSVEITKLQTLLKFLHVEAKT